MVKKLCPIKKTSMIFLSRRPASYLVDKILETYYFKLQFMKLNPSAADGHDLRLLQAATKMFHLD